MNRISPAFALRVFLALGLLTYGCSSTGGEGGTTSTASATATGGTSTSTSVASNTKATATATTTTTSAGTGTVTGTLTGTADGGAAKADAGQARDATGGGTADAGAVKADAAQARDTAAPADVKQTIDSPRTEGSTKPPTDHLLWADASRGEWTLVTVPDIQHFSQGVEDINKLMDGFKWLVANKDYLNLKMIQGLGDMVERCDTPSHWENAAKAWKILIDGNLPNSPAPGNHDAPGQDSSTWTRFNQYFPISSFNTKPWWGGSYSGGMEAHYMLATIGSEDYLFLTLSDVPDTAELTWAKNLLNQNPNKRVIIATHNGQNKTVENSLLKLAFKQIVLFNCGHACAPVHWTVTPSNGGLIQCFQTDYQCDNPETGLLRFYKFKPMEDVVEFYTYSPAVNKFDKRDAVSQGSFPLVQN